MERCHSARMFLRMMTKIYLAIATVAFFVAVTGSDLIARMTIDQRSMSGALSEHLEWASCALAGLLFLMPPSR